MLHTSIVSTPKWLGFGPIIYSRAVTFHKHFIKITWTKFTEIAHCNTSSPVISLPKAGLWFILPSQMHEKGFQMKSEICNLPCRGFMCYLKKSQQLTAGYSFTSDTPLHNSSVWLLLVVFCTWCVAPSLEHSIASYVVYGNTCWCLLATSPGAMIYTFVTNKETMLEAANLLTPRFANTPRG